MNQSTETVQPTLLDLLAPPDVRAEIGAAVEAVQSIIEAHGATLRRGQELLADLDGVMVGGVQLELRRQIDEAGIQLEPTEEDALGELVGGLLGTRRLNELMHQLHALSDPDGLFDEALRGLGVGS